MQQEQDRAGQWSPAPTDIHAATVIFCSLLVASLSHEIESTSLPVLHRRRKQKTNWAPKNTRPHTCIRLLRDRNNSHKPPRLHLRSRTRPPITTIQRNLRELCGRDAFSLSPFAPQILPRSRARVLTLPSHQMVSSSTETAVQRQVTVTAYPNRPFLPLHS